MKIYLLSTILIAALLLFSPSVAYSANSPQSLSPGDGSIVNDSSPKLSWQYSDSCPVSGSCFLVEVDDSEGFDSVYKSTYTNNIYYSPQDLNEGKWFWRVKAKDLSGNWSEWNSTNFTVTLSAQTTSPTASSTTSPLVSPVSGSTVGGSQFAVAGAPSSVNTDQSFSVQVNLSLPSNPNTNYYLKGAFQKSGSSNYFGQTQVSGSWIKNSDTYSKQLSIVTDALGNWSGSLQVMADNEDSGYTGSGNYIFKVGRYSASGSGLTWSNDANISLNGAVVSSTPKPTSKPSSKPSASASAKVGSTVISSGNMSSSVSNSKSVGNKSPVSELPNIASVAGESIVAGVEDQSIEQGERYINWWFMGAGILVLAGTVGLFVKIIKTRYHTTHDFKEQL